MVTPPDGVLKRNPAPGLIAQHSFDSKCIAGVSVSLDQEQSLLHSLKDDTSFSYSHLEECSVAVARPVSRISPVLMIRTKGVNIAHVNKPANPSVEVLNEERTCGNKSLAIPAENPFDPPRPRCLKRSRTSLSSLDEIADSTDDSTIPELTGEASISRDDSLSGSAPFTPDEGLNFDSRQDTPETSVSSTETLADSAALSVESDSDQKPQKHWAMRPRIIVVPGNKGPLWFSQRSYSTPSPRQDVWRPPLTLRKSLTKAAMMSIGLSVRS